MPNNNPLKMTTVLLGSIVWAVALIASAALFKGNPAKEWIQSTLFIVALTLTLFQSHRLTCQQQ